MNDGYKLLCGGDSGLSATALTLENEQTQVLPSCEQCSLLYMLSGRSHLSAQNMDTCFSPGQLALVPAGGRVRLTARGAVLGIKLGLPPRETAGDQNVFTHLADEGIQTLLLETDELSGQNLQLLFGMLFDEMSGRMEYREKSLFALSQQIAIISLRLLHRLPKASDCERNVPEYERSLLVKKAMQYINRHYSEEISLEELARMLWVNPSYLSRQFKLNTGISFTEFISRKRIYMAKSLLVNSNETVSTIALAVGFQNIPYFNSVFKKATGQSPSKYRGQHRNGPDPFEET